MIEKDKSVSTTVGTAKVLQTKDYSIFKKLKGNREPDAKHVGRIKSNMLESGNLTAEFPIVVNEYMEVIDGQHRLEALKQLNWPVGYRIQEGLTLDTVRGINQAQQNWSWKDYAESYIGSGDEEQVKQYSDFLALHNDFGYPKSTIITYCGLGHKNSEGANYQAVFFNQGMLHIPSVNNTRVLLQRYKDVSEALNHNSTKFAYAFYKVMQSPEYDHDRMVHKAKLHNTEFKSQATVEDYARALETIYNFMTKEENRKRLY